MQEPLRVRNHQNHSNDNNNHNVRLVDLLHWIRSFKDNVHCKAVRSPSDLRNGLALTAIVSQIFSQHPNTQRKSSPHLTEEQEEKAIRNAVLNSSPQTCKQNLSAMLAALPKHFTLPADFTSTSLYNDPAILESFVRLLYEHHHSNMNNNNSSSSKQLLSQQDSQQKNSKRPPMPLKPKQQTRGRKQDNNADNNEQQSPDSSAELFYASDLNMLNDDDIIDHANNNNILSDDNSSQQYTATKQQLETSTYSIIRPNSPYQFTQKPSPSLPPPPPTVVAAAAATATAGSLNTQPAILRPRQNSFSSDISEIPFPTKNAAMGSSHLTPMTIAAATAQNSWINDETPGKDQHNNTFDSSAINLQPSFLKVSSYLNSSQKIPPTQTNPSSNVNAAETASPATTTTAMHTTQQAQNKQVKPQKQQQLQRSHYNITDEDTNSTSFLSKHLFSDQDNNATTIPTKRNTKQQLQQQHQPYYQQQNPNTSTNSYAHTLPVQSTRPHTYYDKSPYSSSRDRLKKEISALDAKINEESRGIKVVSAPTPIMPSSKSTIAKDMSALQENNLIITPTSSEAISRVLKWLIEIGLIRKDILNLESKLPKVCANGVIFFDLINRLSSRADPTLPGCIRNPKSPQQFKANFTKLFTYLRSLPRINSRYLFHADQHLINANPHVFWGLLDDIWHLYHRKPTTQTASTHQSLTSRTKTQDNSTTPSKQKPEDQYDNILANSNNANNKNKLQKTRSSTVTATPTTQQVSKNAYNTTPIKSSPITSSINAVAVASSPNKQQQNPQTTTREKNIPTSHSDSYYAKTNRSRCSSSSNQYNYTERSPSYQPRESYADISQHRKAVNFQVSTQSPCSASRRRSLTPTTARRNSPRPSHDVSSFFSTSPFSKRQSTHNTDSSFSRNSPRYSQRNLANPTNNATFIQPLTLETEMQTREFLSRLGFTKFLVKKDKPLFEDPLRNGTLIATLLHTLNPIRINAPVFQSPCNMNECHSNIASAFEQLYQINHAIPRCLFTSVDQILKGDHDTTWGLLYYIMKNEKSIKSASTIDANNTTINASSELNHPVCYLPYSAAEISAIEISLVQWVNSYIKPKTSLSNFSSIKAHISSGILLCEMTAVILQQQQLQEFAPSHANPQTESHRIANIRKALTRLRQIEGLKSSPLWMEAQLLQQDHSTIIQLLLDLRNFLQQTTPLSVATATTPSTIQTATLRTSNSIDNTRLAQLPKTNELQLNPSTTLPSSRSFTSRPHETLHKIGLPPTSSPTVASWRYANKAVSEQSDSAALKSNRSLLPTSSAQSIQSARSITPQSLTNNAAQQSSSSSSPFVQHLLNWLRDLGVGGQLSLEDFSRDKITVFQDGVLLCKIVEKLLSRAIPGVIARPASSTSCLENIRKAFFALQTSAPNFDANLLLDEKHFASGKQNYILAFLSSLKQTFKAQQQQQQRQLLPQQHQLHSHQN